MRNRSDSQGAILDREPHPKHGEKFTWASYGDRPFNQQDTQAKSWNTSESGRSRGGSCEWKSVAYTWWNTRRTFCMFCVNKAERSETLCSNLVCYCMVYISENNILESFREVSHRMGVSDLWKTKTVSRARLCPGHVYHRRNHNAKFIRCNSSTGEATL